MNITITGSTGFVGTNLIHHLAGIHNFSRHKKNTNFYISEDTDIVIHLAGKAHDILNLKNSEEYYRINTDFTKIVYDSFLISNAKIFITLSSVKAVVDKLNYELTEEHKTDPKTHYGKSKLLAENYILHQSTSKDKRFYILRPCMIHGPGNKGNLNLLYNIAVKGFPWPLGSFENKRSFCSIENLCFIINELIENDKIPSGVYNISDDEPISTNDIIHLISAGQKKKPHIWNVPQSLIKFFSKFGDVLRLPLNTERLSKLTETYIVSNNKIKNAINKPLPISSKEGLIKTFNSFKKNA